MSTTTLSWFLFSAGIGLAVLSAILAGLTSGSLANAQDARAALRRRLRAIRSPTIWVLMFTARLGVALAVFGFFYPFLVYAVGKG